MTMQHDNQPLESAPPSMRAALHLVLLAPDSYGLVLALLMVSFILAPLAQGVEWLWVRVLVLGVTVLFALHTSRIHRRTFRVAVGIVLVALLLTLIAITVDGNTHTQGQIAALLALLFAISVPAMLRRILTASQVDLEVVLGALDVYIILGMFFAAVYAAIGDLTGTAFFTGVQHVTPGSYQFFSFVTLTTVGYGNLVPAGQWGQSLAVMEALFGQVYLVTLVARLVSAWQPGIRRPPRERLLDEQGRTPQVGDGSGNAPAPTPSISSVQSTEAHRSIGTVSIGPTLTPRSADHEYLENRSPTV